MEYLSTLKLTSVDYFTLVVLLVSALVGISRGLFKEVLALASWFVAAWVAYHYTNYLSTEWLSTFHLDELLSLGLSFLILFILTLIICGLCGGVVQKIILSAGLSLTDRFLGLVFGLARGTVIATVGIGVLSLTPLVEDAWYQRSELAPYFETVADWGLEELQARIGRNPGQ